MKILLTLAFLAIHFIAYSQSIVVDYEYKIIHDDGSKFEKEYKLYDNSQYSTYVWDVTNFRPDSTLITFRDDRGNVETKKSAPQIIKTNGNEVEQYVDKANGVLLDKRSVSSKARVIKEDLPLMEWTLTDKDTVYINFPCKIATTEFRGNSWTVFFTDSLGFNAAPWKLHGLPGTVLYAVASEGKFTIKATGIAVEQNSIEIKNPFEEIKTKYSWEEYKKEYKNFHRKFVKGMKSANSDSDISIKVQKGIEDMGFE